LKRILAVVVCLAASSAAADTRQDSIVAQLRAQGFTRIQISRTLLGRSRIVATSRTQKREIVINPVTGAILRDYWTDKSQSNDGSMLFNSEPDDGENASAEEGGDEGEDGGYGGDEGDDGGEDGGQGGDEGDDGGDDGDSGGGDEGDDGGSGGDEGDSDGHGGGGEGDDD